MALGRYVCEKCDRIHEFDSRRKRLICPVCSSDLTFSRLMFSRVVNGTYCRGLASEPSKKLEIPDGTLYIESGAFKYCGGIEEIVFPKTLKSIPYDCFQGALSLKKVIIPGNVKTVGTESFKGCWSLEEVLISDGVEIIESGAFEDCKNLRFVRLPSTLKKIGRRAFDTDCYLYGENASQRKFKRVVLTPFIEVIDNDAFGNLKEQNIVFGISKGSYCEKYAKEQGLNYQICDSKSGTIVCCEVFGSTLYFLKNINKTIKIPPDVKKIEKYAFYGHKKIEEVFLSSDVEEISECAFLKCKGIKNIIFNDKLKSIGSKAFSDFQGVMVDLPPSIEKLADDAFPKHCMVSIGGDMPFYTARLEQLQEHKITIDAKKKHFADLEVQLEEAKARLEEHIASVPSKFDEIPGLREEIRSIEESRDVERSFNNDERNYLNKRIFEVESKINQLQAERKNCFFLAFTKKREIDEDIACRQSELQSIRDDLQKLSNKSRDDEKKFADLIAPIKRNLDALLGEQKRWNDNKSYLTRARDDVEKEIKSLSSEITGLSEKLKEDEEALSKEHDKWIKTKEKTLRQIEKEKQEAEELKRRQKLETEKEKIISEISIPVCPTIPLFECNNREAVVDERLLNEALLGMATDLNKEKRATTHNRYVEANSAKIERVKEINILLGYEREQDVMGFAPLPMQEIADTYIPERVSVLCKCFAKSEYWSRFKHAAIDIRKKKNAKANIHDKFFADLDYFAFEYEGKYLLMLPYCMVIFEAKKPMVVLMYKKAVLAVKYTDKEEIRDDIPPFGEIIHERHKHINADGSVSRRYKDNPIIKTIRYTTVTIKAGNNSFTFPTKTQDEAMQFENAFNSYRKVLTTGLAGDVYSLLEISREHSEIVEALNNLAKEEARLREFEKQREAEAKRRLEEERIAAEKAADERKKAIIQRQRELNAERKREAEKLAEERRRVVKLFDDDFEADTANVVTEESNNAIIPAQIIGNRLISNNVFKVTLKFVEEFKAESLIAYFVTNSGETISNKKKISVTTDDITIGFVLNSGIDYTTMQECLMRFESQGDILWNIDFKMNISFYSDF